ncbi:MAG: ABC transporter permease, partial [Thermoanaerobaculia bacterium]|nr:ABC transporter permease [Thermoanaerobaculia bacterium]
PPLVAAVVAIALFIGVVFGLVPGLGLRRTDLRSVLHHRGAGRLDGGAGERFRQALVVVEVASAVALLLGSLVLVKSFRALAETDPGFATERLLTVRTSLPASSYPDDPRLRQAGRDLAARLGELAGVESAILWSPNMPAQSLWYRSFAPAGRHVASLSDTLAARFHMVGPGALEALGIPLLRGRTIGAEDHADAEPVAVVSESAATVLFRDADPIGRRLHRWRSADSAAVERHYTIVGVVADTFQGGRTQPGIPAADVYFAFDQLPGREISLLVRSDRAAALGAELRDAVRAVDPALPLFDVQTMRERLATEEGPARFSALLGSGFALVASALAGLGLYSVVSFVVLSRTREVGLRMALGGRARDIVGWIGATTGRVVALGLALGFLAALGLSRVLAGAFFGIDTWDTGSAVLALLAMIAVTALAALGPVLRAIRVDPMQALRSE